ncbi:MAG TPA: hypothetical protein D7H99_01185 [Candidatus Poseidoniales archaeon]|nr:MAG TPA: hypothetical protein D7H99_01185 [Candidatus Poseidoniales archaeon]HII57542.1 hypothetical protein [Candidatus Poseidoniaceae archaeon]|tara:strand:- start:521 stop:1624 length:1104 start_codon:yes stop_codon:yes gene_type:complete
MSEGELAVADEVTEEGNIAETPTIEEVDEENFETLASLQEALKKSRWNVFTFLGIALLMFAFALFPMPMDADFEYGTAEKDIGFVWGPSLAGEDFMDVPYEVTVSVERLPPTTENTTLEVYVLQTDDCTNTEVVSEAENTAKLSDSHEYQFGFVNSPIEGKEYVFDFNLDMAQYCLNAKIVYDDGTVLDPSATNLKVTGKLWPNQVIAGVPGLFFLGLSSFAFIGAQKVGKKVKALLENDKVTEEQIVLEDARKQKISQGPSGPPKPVAGPGGPPQSVSGPTGSPQSADPSSGPANVASTPTESQRAGPPPASSTQASPAETFAEPTESSTYEDAGNGYFYRKMADGSYEQTIYIQDQSGQYIPYES